MISTFVPVLKAVGNFFEEGRKAAQAVVNLCTAGVIAVACLMKQIVIDPIETSEELEEPP